MKGHIRQRGKESWEITVDLPRDGTGKRRQQRKTVRGGKRKAQNALADMISEINQGTYVAPAQKTVRQFFDDWFRDHAKPTCSAKTVERYSQLATDYILPTLGEVKLTDVSGLRLQRLLNDLRARGGRFRKRAKDETVRRRPLSISTVRHVHGLLKVVFNTAIEWRLLKFNPAFACKPPKKEKRRLKVEAVDGLHVKLNWLLEAARAEVPWVYPFLELAIASGCRRGELLALTRTDCAIDSEPPIVSISKSLEQTKAHGLRIKGTKTGEAHRLKMPKRAAEVLRVHLAAQDERRRQLGPDYRADLDLVFSDPFGNYLKPDSVSAKVSALMRKCGLKGVSLHSARHLHATQLIAAGVPLPVVSSRLGHSDVTTTASIYVHALKKDELAAADAWDALMERQQSEPQTECWQSVGNSTLPN